MDQHAGALLGGADQRGRGEEPTKAVGAGHVASEASANQAGAEAVDGHSRTGEAGGQLVGEQDVEELGPPVGELSGQPGVLTEVLEPLGVEWPGHPMGLRPGDDDARR